MSPREDLLKSAGRPVPGALRVGIRDRTSGIVLRVRTRLFAAFVGIAACVPFFDTAPTGTVVADLGSGDSGADVVDTGPTVFPTEDGWQCGEFEIRTSPQAGELCGDLMECPQGLCLVVDNNGATCSPVCSPAHCPEICGDGSVCGAGPESFSDGTPIGYCMPEAPPYGLCTTDQQCDGGSFCVNVVDLGIAPFGWCVPRCEGTCPQFEGAEPLCSALGETDDSPRGCVVLCNPNVDDPGCPGTLGCVGFGGEFGFCADFPFWLRQLFETFE